MKHLSQLLFDQPQQQHQQQPQQHQTHQHHQHHQHQQRQQQQQPQPLTNITMMYWCFSDVFEEVVSVDENLKRYQPKRVLLFEFLLPQIRVDFRRRKIMIVILS